MYVKTEKRQGGYVVEATVYDDDGEARCSGYGRTEDEALKALGLLFVASLPLNPPIALRDAA
jgi:hypothetical protein